MFVVTWVSRLYAVNIFLANLHKGLSLPAFGFPRKFLLEVAPRRYDLNVLRFEQRMGLGHQQLAAVFDPPFGRVRDDEGITILDGFLQQFALESKNCTAVSSVLARILRSFSLMELSTNPAIFPKNVVHSRVSSQSKMMTTGQPKLLFCSLMEGESEITFFIIRVLMNHIRQSSSVLLVHRRSTSSVLLTTTASWCGDSGSFAYLPSSSSSEFCGPMSTSGCICRGSLKISLAVLPGDVE